MRGELGAVWPSVWEEIWTPLFRHPEFGDDLPIDLFREHVAKPKPTKPLNEMTKDELLLFVTASREFEEIVSSTENAAAWLQSNVFAKPKPESYAVKFLEKSLRA